VAVECEGEHRGGGSQCGEENRLFGRLFLLPNNNQYVYWLL